jgi:hypothetical protein
MPGTGARAKHRADSLQHTSCRRSPLCPERVPERMNYAPSLIKTQILRPEAGLLQMHPVGAHLYAQNGCQSEVSCHTPSCRSSPRERINYAQNLIKTQPFGQRAGLLQMHPVGAHPYAQNGCQSEVSCHTPSCRSSPRERINYAQNLIKTQPFGQRLTSYIQSL